MRSNIFDVGSGHLVAYPSIGGVVQSVPMPVDLQYLAMPRTHDTKPSPDDDEDDIAARMLRLGAQWWPDWELYAKYCEQIDNGVIYDCHFPSDM
ncbi:uncharacterized protein ColSpa_03553 [Colletotrichum spaethianum]|uniref:Uncharacterized protein n=1 Tax=Colletotrichum spaethianum TaxID=700344 RepID=A0AA37NVK7_9PEZI|nr:uncharacterized protein ColSpa_03553 [Colletotrichum spaethianum]GKT43372.1 hypothetical protein ColSpa_03553 [Colletotrichum spaethianum]